MARALRRRAIPLRIALVYVVVALIMSMVGVGAAAPKTEKDSGHWSGTTVSDESAVEEPGDVPPADVPAEEPEDEAEPPADEPEPSAEEPPAEEPAAVEPEAAPVLAAVPVPAEAVVVPNASVTPVYVPGNPAVDGFKIDNSDLQSAGDLTYTDPDTGAVVNLHIYEIEDVGWFFDFTSTLPVSQVVAKAQNAYIYYYDPPVYGDTGLYCPQNDSGKYPQISHLIFVFEEEEPTYEIVVHKFQDLDGDGAFNGVDVALSDPVFTFDLWDGDPSGAGMIVDTQSTVAGLATFTGLAPGTYYITEQSVSGWHATTTLPVTVVIVDEDGIAWVGNDEDEPEQVHIIVTKFYDDSGDGYRQGGEDWLAGFEFELFSGPGPDGPWTSVMTSTTVGPNGQADFGMHDFGWYKIVEVLSPGQIGDGWYCTTNTGDGVGVKIFETTGEYNASLWFGNLQEEEERYVLKVHKFHDKGGEEGVFDNDDEWLGDPTFTFDLWDGDPAGSGMIVDTQSTDSNGYATFNGLLPGTYYVTERDTGDWYATTTLPAEVTIIEADVEIEVGNNHDLTKTFELTYEDADPDATFYVLYWLAGEDLSGPGHRVDLVGPAPVFSSDVPLPYGSLIVAVTWHMEWNGLDLEMRFDEFEPPGEEITEDLVNSVDYDPRISGHKFNNLNGGDGDSDWDDGEPPIEDWWIYIDRWVDEPGEPVGIPTGPSDPGSWVLYDQVQTDENGYYEFTQLPPGWYRIREEDRSPDWVATAFPAQTVFEILDDSYYDDIDFGNTETVTKTFTLYYPDAPEGWTFEIEYQLTDDQGTVMVGPEALTGSGPYTFEVDYLTGVEIGTVWWYAVRTSDSYRILLDSTTGEVLLEDMNNELEYGASISGHKFDDYDGEGDWDKTGDFAEPGIEGWTIYLYRLWPTRLDDVVFNDVMPEPPMGYELYASTTTGPGGAYSFTGLLPGVYMVAEETVDGWIMTAWPTDQPYEVGNGSEYTDKDFGNAEFAPAPLDLTIQKKVSQPVVEAGDEISYTLTWWMTDELSPEVALDYTIVDDYDERYIEIIGTIPFGGVDNGDTITWTFAGPLSYEDGKQTLTYQAKVKTDIPEDLKRIDNYVEIDDERDYDPTNNKDKAHVILEEPFLPFTGGDAGLLLALALSSGLAGAVIRRRGKRS